jgi:hypothetical protein
MVSHMKSFSHINMHVESHWEPCDIFILLILLIYISECLWSLKTPSLYENKLLYECKVLWNKIVKRTKILIFKGFNKIYNYVKYMIKKMMWHNSYT